ncbi:hypothetical protein ABZ719_31830 [Streptomyces sp. NPDC006743]|uniref:hypothetical protein n=1 Tax=Streptomyces sp. NPDC006743 TaxID=3154480 RepID=UPI0034551605
MRAEASIFDPLVSSGAVLGEVGPVMTTADLVVLGDGVDDGQPDAGEGVDMLLLRVIESCGARSGLR